MTLLSLGRWAHLLWACWIFLSLSVHGQDPARAAFEIDVGPASTGIAADVSGPHGLNGEAMNLR